MSDNINNSIRNFASSSGSQMVRNKQSNGNGGCGGRMGTRVGLNDDNGRNAMDSSNVAGPSTSSKQQQSNTVLKVISSQIYNQSLDDVNATDTSEQQEDAALSMLLEQNIAEDDEDEDDASDDDEEYEDDYYNVAGTSGGELFGIPARSNNERRGDISSSSTSVVASSSSAACSSSSSSSSSSSGSSNNNNNNNNGTGGVKKTRTANASSSSKRPKTTPKRGRKDKCGKGLRHFSMKVCEKVRQKGTTTYNEVADELVEEFTNPANTTYVGEQYDQKNIRRRVYDALNVLMAMNIISKERKEIRWIGLPTNTLQECLQLIQLRKQRMAEVTGRLKHLYQLVQHQIGYKALFERNMKNEQKNGPTPESTRLHIPFVVVSTSKDTSVECNISLDKSEYLMHFDDKFEVTDDIELMRQMGLLKGLDKGECSESTLKHFKTLLPKSLHPFIERVGTGNREFTMEDFDKFVDDCEHASPSTSSDSQQQETEDND